MTDTQTIKKALINHYGKNRILSVRHGRGTAAGWIEVDMLINKPTTCTCDKGFYCYECKKAMRDADNNATKIIKQTGVELSTYTDDMGYGDHDCILINVRFIGE